MNRNKLYFILFTACLIGYIWLWFVIKQQSFNKTTFTTCIVKSTTGIPCPSCGSTRSVIEIIKGNYFNSLYLNPLGFIILFFMMCIPSWITFDVILKKNTFYIFYKKAEFYIKKPTIALPLIILIFINWMWNIYKNL